MKKRLLCILTVCLMLCTVAFTMSACGSSAKKLTFMVDGGVYHKIILEDEEIPAFPSDPAKAGYEFIGWFDGDTQVTQFTEPLTTSKTLVAKWDAIEYKVTFKIDGVEVGSSTFTLDDTELTGAPQIPERIGYVGTWEYTFAPNDIEAIATYSLAEYTITYVNADGVENPNPKTYTIETETITLENLGDLNGFPFIGWFNANGKVTEIAKGSYGNITLTAKFDRYSLGLSIKESADGTYAIVTGMGTCKDREIILPSVYNNLPVKEVAYEAFYKQDIISVTIPESIVTIDDYAFYGCEKLVEVYNYSDLDITAGDYDHGYVAEYAYNVYTDPSAVSKLFITDDGYAFYKADEGTYLCWYEGKDKNLTFPSTFEGKTYSIGKRAFYDNKTIESVVIPEGVTTIGENAFYYCSLKKITLPKSLAKTEDYAFLLPSDCSVYYNGSIADWVSIDFEDSIFDFGVKFFIDNKLVTNIVIPDGVTTIKDNCFSDYSYFMSVTLGKDLTNIESYAFGYSTLYPFEVYNLTGEDLSYLSFSLNRNARVVHTSADAPSKISIVDNKYAFYDGDDEKVLIRYLGDATEVTLPATFNGSNYSIYDYAFSNSEVEKVTLGNVTEIGSSAFANTDITEIVIPDTTTIIKNSAFSNCTKLNSIVIGKNVTEIQSSAFSDCRKLLNVCNLSNLTITAGSDTNGKVGYYAYAITTSTTQETPYVKVGDYTFYNDNGSYYLVAYTGTSKNLVLPEGVNGNTYAIGKMVFYFSEIESVVIPDMVTEIGAEAFRGSFNLSSLSLGKDVAIIRNSAFGNTNISEVKGGENVVTIENSAFTSCYSLAKVGFTKVETIGDYAFSSTILTEFNFGDKIKTIGKHAFNGAKFTKVVLPETLEYVDDYAFNSCQELVINAQTPTITKYSFYYCEPTSITSPAYSADIVKTMQRLQPGTVTLTITSGSISESLLSSTAALKEIIIKSKVTAIQRSAFNGCDYLTKVTIEEGVQEVGNYAFANSGIEEITLPKSVIHFGSYIFYNCKSLVSATLSEGALVMAEMFKDCTALTTVNLDDSITAIGYEAFYGCTSLKSFTAGPNIKTIADYAFKRSGLTTLVIGDNVLTIGAYAFDGCADLKTVTLGAKVKTIDEYAFRGCWALTQITIPSTVKTIGSCAFYNTGLNHVIFVTPTNWYANPPSGSSVKLNYLDQSSTAAKYLKTTYYLHEWTRS